MGNYKKVVTLILLGLLLALPFTGSWAASEKPLHRIVVFKKAVDDVTAGKIISRAGGTVKKSLRLINGQAVVLPSAAAEKALTGDPDVLRIDEDVVISVTKAAATTQVQPAQSIPWGISRIGADQAWATSNGQAVKVAIIDTGVDMNHPDLQANLRDGINTISSRKTYQDDNGHGTHVAGIIGAVYNSIGVAGIAPQVDIYAVKALGRNGSGYLSDIIEGLQWSVNNGMQVINMSLGTNSDIQSFHDAVTAVYNAGIIQVAAAGNDGDIDSSGVDYPASYPETIAVSAVDSNGQVAAWSSRGPEVDLAAPGVNINSTWNNDLYKSISGTSMATPHVTGTAALTLAAKRQLDPGYIMSPDEMKAHLKATAENLGYGPNLQGAGMVNALAAIQ